jgi:pilus assembly protein Flp/PilA
MLKWIPEQSLLDIAASLMKGIEMLAQLVKFQAKIAALRSDRGATAVEYGLMVALIAVVVIVAVTFLGSQVSGLFQNVGGKV